MFETDLFKYDFELVPEVTSLFAKMEVKHEPLTLIVPQFETPLLGTIDLRKDWPREYFPPCSRNCRTRPWSCSI